MLALGVSTSTSAQEMRIQFAEKVQLPAVAGHAEFDAFGRRFSVDLESNDRLQSRLAVASKLGAARGRLFRGKLENVPGSWVRLSKVGNGVEGAIWDGRDLYVVTSLANISANLIQQPDATAGDTVVYRLSDTLGGLPAQFCGLGKDLPASAASAPTALDQYKSLVADLRMNAAAAVPTEQLDLSVITDAEFDQYYGQLAHDAIPQRINIVDGIFSEQVGVLIMPSGLHVTGASPDPFNSNDPSTLLDKLADYREATPAVRAAGLAHLITGRDLDGNVLGIAFLDSLCEPRKGVSLSDSSSGSFYGALVMAHELAHNFGAEHDGQSGSACVSTPQDFLMAPFLNGNTLFSQCSLSSMQAPIVRARGRCIGAPRFADLGLDVPASPYVVDVSSPFSFPVTVRSHGNLAAQNSVLRVYLPSEITFQSATGASCSVANGTVTCPLGLLAAGESRTVDVRLLGSAQRTFTVTGAVEAANDFLTADNVKNVTVGVQSSIDAATSITLTPNTVFTNDTAEIAVDVQSLRTSAVRDARLIVQTGYMPILSIDGGANSCAIRPADYWNVECTLADIGPGASTRVLIRVRAPGTGTRDVAAVVIAPNDGEFTNNRADHSLTVQAEREVIVTPSVESIRAAVGGTYDVTFTVRTAGRFPVDNALFTAVGPGGDTLLSVTPSVGTCPVPAPQQEWTCEFGTLLPGDVRTVTLSFRTISIGTFGVTGRVRYSDGQSDRVASGFAWVYSALQVDVSVGVNRPLGQLSEGEVGSSGIDIRSEGFDPAQNVVVTFEIPAPARLSNLRTTLVNPSGLQCVLDTPQRGRCTGSFTSPQTGYTYLSFDYMSDAPVDGVMRVEMTADNDAEPSNNVAEARIRVVPFVDLALTSTAQNFTALLGQETTIDVTVTTGRNPSTGVRLDSTGQQPSLELVSMRVNGADCPLTNPYGVTGLRMSCVLGNLPANANVPVTVTYRTLQPDVSGQVNLDLVGVDSTFGNNSRNVRFLTMGLADVQLSIAGTATASGENGSFFTLPRITVSNTTGTAWSVAVQIPLPSFTTVRSVSNSGSCSGTTTLQCTLPPIPAGSSASIDVSLNATGTGTFTSNLVLTSANDSSTANNAATIAISATAAPAPPSGGGGSSSGGGAATGGKGGGGGFEWLGLAFLALLIGRRVVARRAVYLN